MAKVGEISSTTDVSTAGGTGTVILNGPRAPLDTEGATGNYWHDTVGKVLYGPKKSGYGPDKYAIDPATAITYPGVGPKDYTLGFRLQFVVPGVVTAFRFYRSASATVTSRVLTLYRAGVSVATATSSGESGSGWKTVPLATPVWVDTGVVYVTAYRVANDYYVETDTVPPSYSPGYITNTGGCYTAGAAFPATAVSFNYFADLAFNTGVWSVVLKSAP